MERGTIKFANAPALELRETVWAIKLVEKNNINPNRIFTLLIN